MTLLSSCRSTNEDEVTIEKSHPHTTISLKGKLAEDSTKGTDSDHTSTLSDSISVQDPPPKDRDDWIINP